MAIHFINQDRNPEGLKRKMIKEWLKKVIEREMKEVGITNLIFCSDDYLIKVNKEFLKRDYLTDVISFDYTKKNKISGDIMISIDRVQENASENGILFLEELKRVMVHGILHLIGYDDNTKENKSIMTGMEDLYLEGSPE
ncbi:MAG: rRNA maturation RNase YbeY [Bacteroidota bacterium]